jgi:hypothetical protein
MGSYAANQWLAGGFWWPYQLVVNTGPFRVESDVRYPSQTPVFADGINLGWGFGSRVEGPGSFDLPASTLASGSSSSPHSSMPAFTIPRHGSRPSIVSTNHPVTEKLPGESILLRSMDMWRP